MTIEFIAILFVIFTLKSGWWLIIFDIPTIESADLFFFNLIIALSKSLPVVSGDVGSNKAT